jgi:hypothetical protein
MMEQLVEDRVIPVGARSDGAVLTGAKTPWLIVGYRPYGVELSAAPG